MPISHKIAIVLLAAAACGVSSCDNDPNNAYTMRDQYVQGVRSVYVPMWNRNRDVFRRELEFRISEAVIKEIQTSTRYRISDEASADTMLTGEIVEVSQAVMAFNPDSGNPREQEITITIAFVWQDLRDGTVRAQEDALEVTGTYIPDFGEGFFQASQDIFDTAARRVVEHMEADWPVPTPNE